jgi:4-oxalocrotonate tautomerase
LTVAWLREWQVSAMPRAALSGAEDAVSVGIEAIAPPHGTDQVYKPDIRAKPETIYKKIGHNPP